MPDGPKRQKAITLPDRLMDLASRLVFYIVTVLFFLVSVLLICMAFDRLIVTVPAFPQIAPDSMFETIGFTTIAATVFELARTMYEEEIRSDVKMTTPLKIRHFISRFLTVIIVSLAIEQYEHEICDKPMQ